MIRAAVLGSPIAHSLSPQLHKIAYEYLEIEGEYSRFDVKSGQLPTFLTSHPDLNSLSLTMPQRGGPSCRRNHFSHCIAD
jgi:shikimate dehydrogenase